ncbi:MAG: palindromic element RPE2 domain-containing protein [Rickettsia endosymbiont of Gnoriste bilineata]|nr:palindromic element RPE2 domain-containing protein [Rickettsia endosymbiont of Gnoriste bilineata]
MTTIDSCNTMQNIRGILVNQLAKNLEVRYNRGVVNSGEFGARNDGATPISNRRATSDDIPNFS